MLLYKKELEVIFKALKATNGVLSLAEARIRDAILKQLIDFINEFNSAKNAIFTKLCDKDGDTAKTTSNPDGTTTFHFATPEQREELTKEIQILNDESVELSASTQLATILEKTSYKPEFGEAEVIDTILAR